MVLRTNLGTIDLTLLSNKAINEFFLTSCKVGSNELAEIFLKAGADVNYENSKPMEDAISGNYAECVKLLHDNGAIVQKEQLCNAIDNNCEEIIEILISDDSLMTQSVFWEVYNHIRLKYACDVELCIKYIKLFIKRGVMPHVDMICHEMRNGYHGLPGGYEIADLMIELVENCDQEYLTLSRKEKILTAAAESRDVDYVKALLQKWPETTGKEAFVNSIRGGGFPIMELLYEKRVISDEQINQCVMPDDSLFGPSYLNSTLYFYIVKNNTYKTNNEEKANFIKFLFEHGANVYHCAYYATFIEDKSLIDIIKPKLICHCCEQRKRCTDCVVFKDENVAGGELCTALMQRKIIKI